jgi:hypothetical protein
MHRFYVGHNRNGQPAQTHAEICVVMAGLTGAFTAFEATGYWNGEPENTTVIDVVDLMPGAARTIAQALTETFEQECVLLVEMPEAVATLVFREPVAYS